MPLLSENRVQVYLLRVLIEIARKEKNRSFEQSVRIQLNSFIV